MQDQISGIKFEETNINIVVSPFSRLENIPENGDKVWLSRSWMVLTGKR